MEIKCPHCGSKDFIRVRIDQSTSHPRDICTCKKCKKDFAALYAVVKVVEYKGEDDYYENQLPLLRLNRV